MNENERERELADEIYAALQTYTTGGPRDQQSREFKAGISDLGYCSERLRRMLNQENPGETDMLPAFIGTAVGDHAEQALQNAWPDMLRQPKVTLTLDGGTRTYEIPGRPDIVRPSGLILDGKTSRGLSLPARTGATEQQKRFQRHGYAKAAYDAGLFNVELGNVEVGNFWIDRAADDRWVLVNLEPYDPSVIDEMTVWLEETIYNFTHDQPAMKEPPREVCATTCGFFDTCRLYDTDTEGLLTDEAVIAAISQYEEGKDLVRIGERLKDQAKPALAGVNGFANVEGQRYALRWTHINPTTVPESSRRGYDKIDLRKAK